MFVRSLVLILVSGLLYSVSADYNNNEDHEGYNQEQRYQVAGYVDPDLKPEPFLSASALATPRKPRGLKPHQVMRGVSRHKLANKKLYANPNRPTIDRILGSYIFDIDEDTDDPPVLSTLPWVQLATLGTLVMGLNVLFTQLILGMTDAPNIPIPFINPSGKSLQEDSWDFSHSLDMFEDKQNNSDLSEDNFCTPRRICEFRQLFTFVPYVDNFINDYGRRVPALRRQYQEALDTGASGIPCQNLGRENLKDSRADKSSRCDNMAIDMIFRAARYISFK